MTTVSNSTPDGEAARILIDRQVLGLRTAIPAVVVAVAADGTTVDVQPAVSMSQTLDGETRGVPMPVLAGVPLQVLGSTSLGLHVCVPVAPGDDGLLVVCDRAIDNWQFGSGVAMAPLGPTPRHHDLVDAVFIPGLQRSASGIPGFPTDAVEVRNRAGSVKLRVTDTLVEVVGNLLVSGNITAGGNVGALGVISDGSGVLLGTHIHSGVDSGTQTSGPPV